MTLDRATVEGMLTTLRETGKFYADPADILEDWLRKEEALQLVWAGRNSSDLQTRFAYVRAALAPQAEEEKPTEVACRECGGDDDDCEWCAGTGLHYAQAEEEKQ